MIFIRYFNKDKQEYTFWDYMAGSWQKNNGLRIDHFLISNNLINKIKNININKNPRSKLKPSDHTPIEIKLINSTINILYLIISVSFKIDPI